MIDIKQAREAGLQVQVTHEKVHDDKQMKLEKIKDILPNLVNSDGIFDVNALQNFLGEENVASNNQGYSLGFAGKALARAESSRPTQLELRCELEQSKNFASTENIIIRGDNLDALKILKANYDSKVNLIYIDPPYNTKKDNFVYKDNFQKSQEQLIEEFGLKSEMINYLNNIYATQSHSGWLSFMYPRLQLSLELLTDNGVIFISIDDKEQAPLKILCDEIFGNENFLGCMVIKTATDNNPTQISTEHEYMLAYTKDISKQNNWFAPSEAAHLIQQKYEELKNKSNDVALIQHELRLWIRQNSKSLTNVKQYKSVDQNGVFAEGDIANPKHGDYRYDVIHPKTQKPCKVPKKGYRYPENTMLEKIEREEIIFGEDETVLIKTKRRLKDAKDVIRSVIYEDGRAASGNLNDLLGKDVFDNPKSTVILSELFELASSKEALILDFFAGSGTTADVVMQLNAKDGGNRKYIVVQIDAIITEEKAAPFAFCKENKLSPLLSSICIERINRSGNIIKSRLSKSKKQEMLFKNLIPDSEQNECDIGYKVFSLTPIPQFIVESGSSFSLDVTRKSTQDTLYNMLTASGKMLSSKIETIEVNCLYRVDDDYYLTNKCQKALSDLVDNEIYVNPYGNLQLHEWLNLFGMNNDKVKILY